MVNGHVTPTPLQMQVGTTYRIRFINITPSHVNHFVRLVSGNGQLCTSIDVKVH